LFLQRRALPAVPTSNNLTFIALQTEKPLEPQLAVVDIVLHKATDEIVSVAMIPTSTPADRIQYSDGIQKLQRYPSQKMIKVTERLPRVEAIMEAFQFLLLM
jgi:hypothetical protein